MPHPFVKIFRLVGAALLMTAGSDTLAAPPTAPGILAQRSDHPVTLADFPPAREFVSRHHIRVDGKKISYRAVAGETYVGNIHGEPVARIFSFTYLKEGPADPSRPVIFVSNGGPGSSSLWLHMGILGPRIIQLSPEINSASTPPFRFSDNPDSLLDVADLVFIDPVGTGFSHAVGNASDLDFAGVDVDADLIARFIELWLSRHGRWNSPKYVVGESYGTIRAAALSRALVGGPLYNGVMRGITLDGVVLIGSSFSAVRPPSAPAPDPVETQALMLPGMAVTAWYHQRIERGDRTVDALYGEALAYATSDYASALHKLAQGLLTDQERSTVARRLAAFTGLTADEWVSAGLTISTRDYLKRMLAADGLEAGVYDSRFTLPLAGSGGDPVADDPAMGRYVPGYIATFNMMLADDLKVSMPAPYIAIAFGQLAYGWRYDRPSVPNSTSFADDLAIAMRRNPSLRVMVASGFYDMATAAANAQADIQRAKLPTERTIIRNYASGHMLYLGGTAPQFASDLRNFIRRQ